jgi:hypothetical protein
MNGCTLTASVLLPNESFTTALLQQPLLGKPLCMQLHQHHSAGVAKQRKGC